MIFLYLVLQQLRDGNWLTAELAGNPRLVRCHWLVLLRLLPLGPVPHQDLVRAQIPPEQTVTALREAVPRCWNRDRGVLADDAPAPERGRRQPVLAAAAAFVGVSSFVRGQPAGRLGNYGLAQRFHVLWCLFFILIHCRFVRPFQ